MLGNLTAAVQPYLLAVKFIGAALILGAVFFGGCNVQSWRDAKELDAKQAKLTEARAALTAAATALHGSSDALRAFNRQAKADIAAAAEQAQRAAQAADKARKDRAASERRIDELERKLREEQETCTDGRRPICGIKLS